MRLPIVALRVRDELTRGGSVTAAIYGRAQLQRPFLRRRVLICSACADGNSVRRGRHRDPFRGRRMLARLDPGGGTDKGVCAIEFATIPRIGARLQDRFANARLVGGDASFERLVADVVGFVEAPAQGSTCRSISEGPRSSSASGRHPRDPADRPRAMARLPRAYRRPKAVRAVAQACASNAIAVAIRAIASCGATGSSSGYRWASSASAPCSRRRRPDTACDRRRSAR